MRFTATRAKTLATSLLIVTAGLGLAACSGSSSSDSTTPATKQTAGKTSDGGVATPSADSKMTGGATGGSAQPTAPQGQQPGGDNQQGGQQPGRDHGRARRSDELADGDACVLLVTCPVHRLLRHGCLLSGGCSR